MTNVIVQDRSHGPDRCRGSVYCRHWHDQGSEGTQTGTGTGTSPVTGATNYNCCCCDPCRYIRPRPLAGWLEYDWEHCVRCIPRSLLLTFIPYNNQAECCKRVTVLMPHTTHPSSELISIYSGTLFGVSVTVELGNLPSGTGTATVCAWHFTMTDTGTGGVDTTVEIDHVNVTSLSVPTVTMENVTGQNNCEGYLVIQDNHRRKVPFTRKSGELSWETGTGTGTTEVESIALDPPCGSCTTVCSRICATGYRHASSQHGYTVYSWFDDCVGTGSASCRGWEYTDPDTLAVERFYLEEDEQGRCTIRPELEAGGEIYNPEIVDADRLCSCRLKMTFTAIVVIGGLPTAISLTLRCGECTCWDYLCGGCRCVPETLCVFYWDGVTIHQNLQLVWDPVELRWGTVADPLMLQPIGNATGSACIITPIINGVAAEAVTGVFPTLTCTKESATHLYDRDNDVVSLSYFGTVDLPSATGTGTTRMNMAFLASAPMPDCDRGPCTEATPCWQECGSHPPHLILQYEQWGEVGDFSEPYAGATCEAVEVDLIYWEMVSYIDAEPLSVKYDCGYLGFFTVGNCCVVKVELMNGEVRLSSMGSVPPGCQIPLGADLVIPLTTETCDPYYAQSDVIFDSGINTICIDCTDVTARVRVTITEA